MISEKVIEKIRREKAVPRARWKFRLAHAIILTLLFGCLIVGGLALGTVLEIIGEFDLGNVLSRPKGLRLAISSLPYVWLICMVIFLALAVAEYLRTRHGYRYRLRNVLGILFIAIAVLGAGFYASGLTFRLENYLENNVPHYGKLTKTPQNFWYQPEEGLIWGRIISNDPGNKLLEIESPGEIFWQVDYSEATIRPRVSFQQGENIRAIGKEKGDNNFMAEDIKPFVGKRMFRNQRGVGYGMDGGCVKGGGMRKNDGKIK
jgi:hypothetical protein